MKRFYKDVAVEETDAGFAVCLDGRQVRTPGKAAFVLPSRALADCAADEWAAQEEDIRPTTMPITRLANTSIDIVGKSRADVVRNLANYADTDLLCYRADQPRDLASRQAEGWQPLIDWAARHYGAMLKATTGVGHIRQDQAALDALANAVAGHDDWELAALNDLVTIFGSLVLALAVSADQLDWTRAWELSRLDETYQNELWGEDAEARAREDKRRGEVEEAHRFLELLRAG